VLQRLVILGPPGGGKGTLAARLGERLGVPHISTGDMLREEVASSSTLGRRAHGHMNAGRLVPDALVTEITTRRLTKPDAVKGWILDGFPRNLTQAQALDGALTGAGPEAVIVIEVQDKEVFIRIAGRLTCPRGHVYNLMRSPPKDPGICDIDGEKLSQREDASPDVVKERLAIYKRATTPVLDYYYNEGILHRVNGVGAPEEVYNRVLEMLESTWS
jgi:adenylate kinase